MEKSKLIIISFCLTFIMVLSTTFIYRNNICCMFGTTRYYGWPGSFISVSKSTSELAEAEKINYESLNYLLNNGWKMSFNTEPTAKFGPTPSAGANLILNFFLYFGISFILVYGWNKICACFK